MSILHLKEGNDLIEAQFHPTRPWVLITSPLSATVCWTRSGIVLHSFTCGGNVGPLKSARFFDANTLIHNSFLPSALVAEARANLVIGICGKAIIVYDCVTKLSVTYTPSLAIGSGSSKTLGALTGASVVVSCEHIVVGTTTGSLFTINVQNGTVSTFSGTSQIHEKPINLMTAITGRPSPQLHRARIVTGCSAGIVAVWEVVCATPVYQNRPRIIAKDVNSPVVDLQFDGTKNRLVCSFANGYIMIWEFFEHSQEETLLATITNKASIGSQVAFPTGAWNGVDDSLLVASIQGKLMSAIPLASAGKLIHSIRGGIISNNNLQHIDHKSPLVSEGIVYIRTVIDLQAMEKKLSLREGIANTTNNNNHSSEKKKIVKFWQHPLDSCLFLLLVNEPSSSTSLYMVKLNNHSPLLQTTNNRVLGIVDGRLVTRTGQRFQNEKVLASLSPYISFSSTPQIFKEDSKGKEFKEVEEELWPGPISMVSTSDYIGFYWPDAKRYVICNAENIQPVQDGKADCIGLIQNQGQDFVFIAKQEESSSNSTALTVSSQMKKSGTGNLLMFRSFRGSSSFSNKQQQQHSSKQQQQQQNNFHFNFVLTISSLNSNGAAFDVPLDRPIDEIIYGGEGDLFLMRSNPKDLPIKPWSRFFNLKLLLSDRKMVSVGPSLPPHNLVSCWSHDISSSDGNNNKRVSYAFTFDQILDRILIMDVIDSQLQYRSSVFTESQEPCISLKWHFGSLFFATNESLQVAFVGGNVSCKNEECPTITLAARGRNAHPGYTVKNSNNGEQRRESLHLHDDETRPEDGAFSPSPSFVRPWEESDTDATSNFPIPVLRPFLNWVHIIGLEKESGELLLLTPNAKIFPISLSHSLIRIGLLASAGLGQSALKWTSRLPHCPEARDEAVLILEKLGFFKQAASVKGASPILLLDVCIKHRCHEQAVKIFGPKSRNFHEINNWINNGLSNCERLALLLKSAGKEDIISSFVKRLPTEKERKFCMALVSN